MKKLNIIKIGGNVIDNSSSLDLFLSEFSKIKEPKILVHGGGKLATQLATSLGFEQTLIDGRRVTNSKTLDIAIMVYAGLLNKKIVVKLQANKVNALGLSGADGNVLTSQKRKIQEIDFGFVGDLKTEGVDIKILDFILKEKIVPVFCAITHDGHGQLLNTNADTVAAKIASALAAKFEINLIYCFEKKGVLLNPANDDSAIGKLNKTAYEKLKTAGIISKGMIVKLDNAFTALESGVKNVLIGDSASIINLDSFKEGTEIFLD